MGRKKKGDGFLDLPDPDAEGAEAVAEEPAVQQAKKGKGKKGKGKAAAAFDAGKRVDRTKLQQTDSGSISGGAKQLLPCSCRRCCRSGCMTWQTVTMQPTSLHLTHTCSCVCKTCSTGAKVHACHVCMRL
jgi:hypothetical protein